MVLCREEEGPLTKPQGPRQFPLSPRSSSRLCYPSTPSTPGPLQPLHHYRSGGPLFSTHPPTGQLLSEPSHPRDSSLHPLSTFVNLALSLSLTLLSLLELFFSSSLLPSPLHVLGGNELHFYTLAEKASLLRPPPVRVIEAKKEETGGGDEG